MLIVFTALVALVNALLGWFGTPHAIGFGGQTFFTLPGLNHSIESVTGGTFKTFSLEFILGVLYAPIAWLIGIDNRDLMLSGSLLGTRTVLNEFVAYLQLADLLKSGAPLSHRSVVIATYALSGFANFSSIAIQIGGISGIAPTRRHDLAKLGLKAMTVGAIATFMTATVAGILIP
jgi:CNT family concentrative nucleoside transporter